MTMTLRDAGLAVIRMAPWLEAFGRYLYMRLPAAFHDTPTSRLQSHFERESRVTFVQIGAYDGVEADPIRSIVLDNEGWSGVLIEPQPDAFRRLQGNYAAQAARLQLLNVAISDSAGEKQLFCLPESSRQQQSLPSWTGGIASFDAAHLLKHLPGVELVSYPVRTITFAEAAAHVPDGYVDVVVIDAEGHERTIFDAIDLDRHRVRFCIYEHKHLSESDRLALKRKLSGHGFTVKQFGTDTIASRPLAPLQPADTRNLAPTAT
jgi:FkbM family methyltransferase